MGGREWKGGTGGGEGGGLQWNKSVRDAKIIRIHSGFSKGLFDRSCKGKINQ